MRIPPLSPLRLVLAIATCAALFVVPSTTAANNSEQVIFSTTGASSPSLGSFAFWVWCEADSSNPYLGECNGSMRFSSLGPARHVDGEITEGPDGIYHMAVTSRDGSISCTLTNTALAVRGPNNTIRVDCTKPAVGTAFVSGAIVNVTGPS